MTKNDRLMQEAHNAIDQAFDDTSVSLQEAIANMRDLKDVIELKILLLQKDLQRA